MPHAMTLHVLTCIDCPMDRFSHKNTKKRWKNSKINMRTGHQPSLNTGWMSSYPARWLQNTKCLEVQIPSHQQSGQVWVYCSRGLAKALRVPQINLSNFLPCVHDIHNFKSIWLVPFLIVVDPCAFTKISPIKFVQVSALIVRPRHMVEKT